MSRKKPGSLPNKLVENELTKYGLENLDEKIIKVEILKYLRQVIKFRLVEDLVKQIEEDVKQIKKFKYPSNLYFHLSS